MPTYASSDLVEFGMIAETTEGTFRTDTAFLTQLTNGISPEFSSNMVEDPTVSGAGEPVDKRTNLRSLGLTTPAQLRYRDLQLGVSAALRDTFPAEVTVVGSSDIDVLTAGTHRDGATGAQLRIASTSAFDDLINYNGVTATSHPDGGIEALMVLLDGSAQSDNNRMRRVKSCWKNGTHSHIDIYPGYVGGSAGAFGAPVVGTTGESIQIKAGQAGRNRFTGAGVKSYSALWQFSDMSLAGWQNGFGLVANDLALSWSGKEGASIEIPWVGYGSGELVQTDPSGQGFDDSGLLFSPMMLAADDLEYVAIVTATTPTVLSQFNLTGFNATLSGNVVAIDDVSGTSEVTGVRRGSHNPAGTIDWHLANDARARVLTQLGSRANNEKAGIDVVFKDADGNRIIVGYLWNEFAPTGPVPGATGNTVGGTLEFSGHRRTNLSRSFTWQEFAA